MKAKIRISAFVLIALGLASWLAEVTFYGDIDTNGVLQESFFLPLSFILAGAAFLMFFVSLFARSK